MRYLISVSGQITVDALDPFEAVTKAMTSYVGQLGAEASGIHMSVMRAREAAPADSFGATRDPQWTEEP